MDQFSIVYRDVAYTVVDQQPERGDLFYHRFLKQVDRVTDITPNGRFITGTELGVCRMINCLLATEIS
ncbi:hypothetical protein GCM10027185_58780 [Spirosoma pulveris]